MKYHKTFKSIGANMTAIIYNKLKKRSFYFSLHDVNECILHYVITYVIAYQLELSTCLQISCSNRFISTTSWDSARSRW